MSDCSAVGNMEKNVMKLNASQASAQAMNAGLDIYGGMAAYLLGCVCARVLCLCVCC